MRTYKKVKALAIVVSIIAIFGNIMFIVETFHPLGELVSYNFGAFGNLLGKFFGLVTFCVDTIILSVLCLPLWNKKLK